MYTQCVLVRSLLILSTSQGIAGTNGAGGGATRDRRHRTLVSLIWLTAFRPKPCGACGFGPLQHLWVVGFTWPSPDAIRSLLSSDPIQNNLGSAATPFCTFDIQETGRNSVLFCSGATGKPICC